VTYSLVPALVPPEDLRASLQMYSITFNISRIAGPVLGVLTITSFGYGWAFAANAVSFLFLIAALLVVEPRDVPRPAIPPRVRDLGRLIASNRRIPILLLLVVAMVMTYDPIQTLAPALVEKGFHAPEQWVGYFLGALGASAIAGTLLTKRESTLPRVCLFLGLFSLGMAWYALAPVPYLALLGPLIGGAGYLQSNTGAQVLLLREAGEERSGQMMALFLMAFSGVRPLISLVDGALADNVGVRQAGLLMVLPGLAVAVAALTLAGRARHSEAALP
jgi:predicted MFS family arabinose efflux permease